MASVLTRLKTGKPVAFNSGVEGQPIKGAIQGGVLNPLPTSTPINTPKMLGTSTDGSTSYTPLKNTGIVPTEQVKQIAANITPENINKGVSLLNSGTGVLTQAQKDLQKLSTSPAMLPKTKALKEAEYIATLPQKSKDETLDTITGSNYMLYGGVALLVLIIIIVALKK